MKSMPPKNTAITKDTPITNRVYFKVVCRVGQLTFLISSRTSFKKVAIFVNISILKAPEALYASILSNKL